jgi:predicted enzyme related to lactoylglutathione lyase
MVKFDHMNLPVTNYQRSRDWYAENFGFKVEFEIPERRTVSLEDSEGMGIFLYEAKAPLTGAKCSLYFQVASVDEKFAELRSKGVPFVNPPGRYFWGYGAELLDPDGYQILLWDPRSMREKGKSDSQ